MSVSVTIIMANAELVISLINRCLRFENGFDTLMDGQLTFLVRSFVVARFALGKTPQSGYCLLCAAFMRFWLAK
jgi:hypothetical protein